jgi:hypothetical protein
MLAALAAVPALSTYLYQPDHEYTDEEVAGLNWFELKLLATEPYARQGQVFDSDWLMAYYLLAVDWYAPIHGSSEHIAAAMEFTAGEEADVARFDEAAAGLEATYDGCWPLEDLSGMEVRHYRAMTSAQHVNLDLPASFYELGEGDGVSIWSSPAFAAEDLITTGRTDADPYYRVHVRPGGTIAAVEALARGYAGDYVLWEARFDQAGALRLFHPVRRHGGCSSRVAIAAFAGGPEDTRPRCLISGGLWGIEMEVRGGPYAELPFRVTLYDREHDGPEVYGKLVGD